MFFLMPLFFCQQKERRDLRQLLGGPEGKRKKTRRIVELRRRVKRCEGEALVNSAVHELQEETDVE